MLLRLERANLFLVSLGRMRVVPLLLRKQRHTGGR